MSLRGTALVANCHNYPMRRTPSEDMETFTAANARKAWSFALDAARHHGMMETATSVAGTNASQGIKGNARCLITTDGY